VRGARERVGRAGAMAFAAAACAGGGNTTTSTSVGVVDSSESDSGSQGGTADDGDTSGGAGSSSTADTSSSSDDGNGAETACEEVQWYPDLDGDGRGNPDTPALGCDPPPGHVPFPDDCNDDDAAISPAATELCDGIDNDCDGLLDEASPMNASCNGCSLFEADGRAYAMCPDPLGWEAARASCVALGTDLVALADAAEQTVVLGFAAPPSNGIGGWFIGLSDLASEGAFVWPDGGAPTFTAWGRGEPNDAAGNEDCAELGLTTALWNDVPCTDLRAYICEGGELSR
jgi:hypothetical protein